MNKSKKFSAAEKHFQEKEIHYQQQINRLNSLVDKFSKQSDTYEILYNAEVKKNSELESQVDKLLERVSMTKEELRCACEQDKRDHKAMETFAALRGIMGRY